MSTEAFWAGSFGNDYLQRNRVKWQDRVPFWQSALDYCQPTNVLEVGCNAGWNLMAMQSIDAGLDAKGVDVNDQAVNEARGHGVEAQVLPAKSITNVFGKESFDLVFTAGVLIHVAPDDLRTVMQAIIDTSRCYVIAIEYENEVEKAVKYRGHKDKLWKRPYGGIYQDMGLQMLSLGKAGGFDKCQYVLLKKAGIPE